MTLFLGNLIELVGGTLRGCVLRIILHPLRAWASGGMVYTKDLKSFGSDVVRVRLPSRPP
jgi:hypothetical protein